MALNGKVAVVTGAAMGIGKTMTEILMKNGASVALLDVNETAGKTLKEALDKQYGKEKSLFLICNVESEEQMKAAFKKTVESFGGMDILCNNAGILNETLWEKIVSINLVGVIRGTYLALEHMSKLKGGRGGVIVNTASMAGLGPLPSCPVYTSTKHGVIGFTRAMAVRKVFQQKVQEDEEIELDGTRLVAYNHPEGSVHLLLAHIAPLGQLTRQLSQIAAKESGYGVRFNALCPGFVQTELFSSIPQRLGQFAHLAEATQQLVDNLGTLNVSEVGEPFLELVTDETKNGEALLVLPKGKQYANFPSFIE